MNKKTFVLDTNVILSDPNAIFSFDDNVVVIPLFVIEELDKQKERQDEAGRNAREFSRKVSALIQSKPNSSLKEGLPLFNGGLLKILSSEDVGETLEVPKELNKNSGDNVILGFCKAYQNSGENITLISRDMVMRIKSEVLGIPCDNYTKLSVTDSVKNLYTGVQTLEDVDVTAFYTSDDGLVLTEEEEKSLHPNEFVILQNGSQSAMARYLDHNRPLKHITELSPSKLQARNKEQKFAVDLLMDQNINLVTIVGQAGTGKTLLAIASGLEQVLSKPQKYKSLVICRPIQPVGKDIGFLPGTMEEKMEPWIAPIKDNLRFLISGGKKGKTNEEIVQYYFDQGIIEVEAMTFIRGRSIANAFMIIDEAQNLNVHELKTILTRAGEGTKIVLTGDIEQIDNMQVDSVSNGLTVAIEKFKGEKISGHVTLQKGERSELASMAAKLL